MFKIFVLAEGIFLFYFFALPFWHNMQLNGYRPEKSFSNNKKLLHSYLYSSFVGLICFIFTYAFIDSEKSEVAFSIICAAYFLIELLPKIEGKAKKPLVYTKRVIRLISCSMLAVSAIFYFICFMGAENLKYFCVLLLPTLAPILVFVIFLLLYPLEKWNNNRYIKKAAKKLDGYKNIIKIGVTGSYGKTSVKSILAAILRTQYIVAETTANYNTPLGIVKSLNNITENTEFFIAEMGARHVGDIDDLCKLVKPKYGILTGITNQHLETFKSLQNIINEKYKLPISLPDDGFAVVGTGRNFTLNHLIKSDYVTAGYGGEIFADNIRTSPLGCQFIIHLKDRSIIVSTRLLGRHNVQNIVLAAALAAKLGVKDENIVKAVGELQPLPHRLQLIQNRGLTIIDDTYNANPVGTSSALEVLSVFNGRKVVITPGMVELGKNEADENYCYGRNIAGVADLVILIGEYPASEIEKGLIEGGFNKTNILNFSSLREAEKQFGTILRTGDIVLFSNDLPDNYS